MSRNTTETGFGAMDYNKEARDLWSRLGIDPDFKGHAEKYQPLDHIREYFGEKIAIYFAWLGFYTSFLLPVAVLGVAVTIYGAVTVEDDAPTKEVCDQDGAVGKLVMCPQCRKPHCDYWPLSMR